MKREINLSPWQVLVTTQSIDNQTLDYWSTILIEHQGQYCYLVEEEQKVFDISQMPDYIKTDWIKYNKKPLNLLALNRQIKKLSADLEQFEEELDLLKRLRRDLILEGII